MSSRLRAGTEIPPFTLETVAHGELEIPGSAWTHLQFRRFAGCPICSPHLRSFVARHDELTQAGIQTVALFHSSVQALRSQHVDLPMPVVPDPERTLYRRFGVERSLLGVAHPRAMWAGMRGMTTRPSLPRGMWGGVHGLPADFLIDPAGIVRHVHYGTHADDSWTVDDVLALKKQEAA